MALHTAQVHPEPTPRPASQPDLTPEGIAARGEKKNDTSAGIGCLVIVVIVVVLVALGSLLGGDDGDDGGGGGGGGSNDRQVDEVTAYEACKSSVESQLRAPGTASFPDYFDQDGEVVITGSGSSLTVSSHVDAENAFGGEVRTQWACDATRTSDGWRGVAMLL